MRATRPPAPPASTSATSSLRSPVVRSVRSAWKVRANRLSMDSGLGIEVGNEFGLEPRDLVLEQELAALQSLQLQLIDPHIELQPLDHVVEVTMFDAQLPQFLQPREQLGIDLVLNVRHASSVAPSRAASIPASHRCHIGATASGSLANPPGRCHGSAGSWKSDPCEPRSPARSARPAAVAVSAAICCPVTTSTAAPPAAAKSASRVRRC